jgi:hypothetical protein
MATIDGIGIPDSKLCREITELVRDTESDLLFNHSSRVYYFSALSGQRRGLNFDRELLYAGAMFHDIGLMPEHSSQTERFEVDGANAARDFLKARSIAPADIDLVWTAIALHTTLSIPVHMHPIVALVNAGVIMDVVGIGYEEFPDAQREAVVAAYPSYAAIQGRHHPGLLRRHQAQTRNGLRHRQCRCVGRQGSAFPPRQRLQCDPRVALEGLRRSAGSTEAEDVSLIRQPNAPLHLSASRPG